MLESFKSSDFSQNEVVEMYQKLEITFREKFGYDLYNAALQKDNGENGVNVSTIQSIMLTSEANEEYFRGFGGVEPAQSVHKLMANFVEVSEKTLGYNRLDQSLLEGLVKPEKGYKGQGYARALVHDVKVANVSDDLFTAAVLIKLNGQAYYRISRRLEALQNQRTKLQAVAGKEQEFWSRILLGNKENNERGLLFYLGSIEGNNEAIKDIFEKAYREKAAEASVYWHAMLYLKQDSLKKKRVALKDVRIPVFTALASGNIETAKMLITDLASQFPFAFSERTLHSLGFSRDLILRQLRERQLLNEKQAVYQIPRRNNSGRDSQRAVPEQAEKKPDEINIEGMKTALLNSVGKFYLLQTVDRSIVSYRIISPRKLSKNIEELSEPAVKPTFMYLKNFEQWRDSPVFTFETKLGRMEITQLYNLMQGKAVELRSTGVVYRLQELGIPADVEHTSIPIDHPAVQQALGKLQATENTASK